MLRRPVEPGQYLAIRYTERLDEAKAVNSVGSKGNNYDNALAETVNALYKAELDRAGERWRTLEEVEFATAAWVHWWNRAASWRLRRCPSGRVRGGLLSPTRRGARRLIPIWESPRIPRAVHYSPTFRFRGLYDAHAGACLG